MKNPLFVKIFSGYSLVTVFVVILILIFSYGPIKNFYIGNVKGELVNLASTLRPTAGELLSDNRSAELDQYVKDLHQKIDTRITVIRQDGVVFADSEEDPLRMENHQFRPEISAALRGEEGFSIRYSETVQRDMLYMAIPIERDGSIIGVMRTSRTLTDIFDLLHNLRRDLVKIAVIIFLIALIGTSLIARGIAKPIRILVAGVKKVAQGDFNVRIMMRKQDEIQDLADNFNAMTERLQSLFTELTQQKEELDIIVSSIREGLIVLNKEGQIVLCNDSFKAIVAENEIHNSFYWEVIRDTEFNGLITQVMNDKQDGAREIQLNDKSYFCSATYLTQRDEVIVVWHDITELNKYVQMKKDLIVSVSHEFRTPLTAIKGFAETLKDEVPEHHHRHLTIIEKNVNRLIHLVEDLAALSAIEQKGAALEYEKINIQELMQGITDLFHAKMEERNLSFQLYIDEDLHELFADSHKLEQLLVNLLENAINYTEAGSIRVVFTLQEQKAIITVQDTGIGIPQEHLPRIFERFYVVDKSRSREKGGTGLGLSIVKNIVLLHQGTIEVDSQVDSGTTFTVSFPMQTS